MSLRFLIGESTSQSVGSHASFVHICMAYDCEIL